MEQSNHPAQIAQNPSPSLPSPPERGDLPTWWAYCREVERDLRRQGLINDGTAEKLGRKESACAMAWASKAHDRFPRVGALLDTPSRQAGFLYRVALDPFARTQALWDRSTDLSASRMSEILGVPPADLKDSHLRALLRAGHFGSREETALPCFRTQPCPKTFEIQPLPESLRKKDRAIDPRLAAAALLISRTLVQEDCIETYLPEIPYSEFHRLQAQVHRAIESTFPERFKRFQSYWGSLTIPQKQALRQVYMGREKNVSHAEAARQLGIAPSTLRERLQGALQKLKKVYPEFADRQPAWLKKDLWKRPDYDEMRLFHFARARKPEPVTRLDPFTRKTVQTQNQAKAKNRTPINGLREAISGWECTNYEPEHNGVGSPRYAHMRAIPAPRPAPALSLANRKCVAERLKRIEAGEEPQLAGCHTQSHDKTPAIPTGLRRADIKTLTFGNARSSGP